MSKSKQFTQEEQIEYLTLVVHSAVHENLIRRSEIERLKESLSSTGLLLKNGERGVRRAGHR